MLSSSIKPSKYSSMAPSRLIVAPIANGFRFEKLGLSLI